MSIIFYGSLEAIEFEWILVEIGIEMKIDIIARVLKRASDIFWDGSFEWGVAEGAKEGGCSFEWGVFIKIDLRDGYEIFHRRWILLWNLLERVRSWEEMRLSGCRRFILWLKNNRWNCWLRCSIMRTELCEKIVRNALFLRSNNWILK